jgi:predicted dienelactone hydrolase
MTQLTATTTETPGAPTGPKPAHKLPDSHLPVVMPTVVDTGEPVPVVSVKPVVLAAPGRGEDLHVRVSAPAAGDDLPIIVFSHGFGSSLEGYGPLAD